MQSLIKIGTSGSGKENDTKDFSIYFAIISPCERDTHDYPLTPKCFAPSLAGTGSIG